MNLTKALSPLTAFFKNWYERRNGKNADEKHLYAWAAENGYSITRFNRISERRCQVMMGEVNYPAFEVEVVGDNVKKGLHVVIAYDVVSVTSYDCEVGMLALEFKKAFRLEDGEIKVYKSGF